MPGGGHLFLEVEGSGADVRIKVGDTGQGIPKETIAQVFKPFFTTKGEKGLGVGLWVSRSIVEKLGGTIAVASSTDPETHGAWFSVTLPAAATSAEKMDERRMAS
jgi:signal transduction histidine kinase